MSMAHSLPFNRPRYGPADPYPPISSLIHPPMDPGAVDFRAFYPYTPNEVKHRKRTTSAQLKVLEGIFKRDTKPNATLRNELATQLDMTARGVQVWFQNRRAKEKTKASKEKRGDQDGSLEGSVEPQQDSRDDPDTSSQESSPTRVSPPQLHVLTDSDSSSWNNSPVPTTDDSLGGGVPFNDLHFLRRGSLPAGELFPADSAICPPLIGHLDPFARRRSVDASLHRLASNPYAHLARAKNGIPHGSRISRARLPYHRPSYAPELQHRASMPYGTLHTRHSSMDSRSFQFSPPGGAGSNSSSPSPLARYTMRASLPDSNLFSFPSRSMGSLIPGPLPSPDFTFGAASTNSSSLTSPCSADSDRSSPEPPFRDIGGYDFDNKGTEQILAEYTNYPRFGSVASTTTDSSFYSENGICKPEDEPLDLNRRDSCSGQFVGMIANLDVSGYEPPFASTGYPEDLHTHEVETAGVYPSPPATAQPDSVPVSHSSELAFALQSQPPQMHKKPSYTHIPTPPIEEPSNSSNNMEQNFFYPTTTSFSQSPVPVPSFDNNEHQASGDNYSMYPSGDMFAVDNQNAPHDHFGHPQDVYSSFAIETNNTATFSYT